MFLGTNDLETAREISERSGEMSILVETHMENHKKFNPLRYTSEFRESSGAGRRKLYTPDEVLRLGEEDELTQLVIVRNQCVLECQKFDYTRHPLYKEYEDLNLPMLEFNPQDEIWFRNDYASESSFHVATSAAEWDQEIQERLENIQTEEETVPHKNTHGAPVADSVTRSRGETPRRMGTPAGLQAATSGSDNPLGREISPTEFAMQLAAERRLAAEERKKREAAAEKRTKRTRDELHPIEPVSIRNTGLQKGGDGPCKEHCQEDAPRTQDNKTAMPRHTGSLNQGTAQSDKKTAGSRPATRSGASPAVGDSGGGMSAEQANLLFGNEEMLSKLDGATEPSDDIRDL